MGKSVTIDSDLLQELLLDSKINTDLLTYLDLQESLIPKTFEDMEYLRTFTMSAPYTMENSDLLSYVRRVYLSKDQRHEIKRGSYNRADQYLMGFGISPNLIGSYIHFPYLNKCASSYKASNGIIVNSKKCEGCSSCENKLCSRYERPVVDWADVYPTMRALSKINKVLDKYYGDSSLIHNAVVSSRTVPFIKKYSGRGKNLMRTIAALDPMMVGVVARHIAKVVNK